MQKSISEHTTRQISKWIGYNSIKLMNKNKLKKCIYFTGK